MCYWLSMNLYYLTDKALLIDTKKLAGLMAAATNYIGVLSN